MRSYTFPLSASALVSVVSFQLLHPSAFMWNKIWEFMIQYLTTSNQCPACKLLIHCSNLMVTMLLPRLNLGFPRMHMMIAPEIHHSPENLNPCSWENQRHLKRSCESRRALVVQWSRCSRRNPFEVLAFQRGDSYLLSGPLHSQITGLPMFYLSSVTMG